MMSVIGTRSTVWFMTVRRRPYTDANNERIRALPPR